MNVAVASGDSPFSRLGRVIAVCDRYEVDWKAGQRPQIEQYLEGVPITERAALFGELLALEAELRKRQGEVPFLEEYRAGFPEFGAEIEAAFTGNTAPSASPDDPACLPEPSSDTANASNADATATYMSDGSGVLGGRFRVLRPHARGNLGEVFVAHDEELHRDVALKEIQAYHAHRPESRAQFVLEAEITGRLEHPGIVPVYGLGYYDDGRPYYAMRFIRGDTLKEAIARFHADEGPGRDPGERVRSLRQLLRRFVDVCNAVAYAHGRSILHRDLKPGNILLGPYGETLVVDWGMAKPIDRPEGVSRPPEGTLRPASGSDSAETEMGEIKGTLAYMSPEQAAGRLDQLGPASDVYGLGATLYCLLVGKVPFEGANRRTVLEEVRAGAYRRPRQVNTSVPAALEAICVKAMALRPEDRYETALALADDVERWLADEPVRAYPENLARRIARRVRRHRTAAQAAATTLIIVTAVSVAATLLVDHARRQAENALAAEKTALTIQRAATRRANENFRKAYDAIELVIQVADQTLATVPRMEGRRGFLAQQALTNCLELLGQRPNDPEVRRQTARVYRLVANIHRGMNQFAQADPCYQRAIALLSGLRDQFPDEPGYRDSLVETALDAGEAMRMRGRPGDGEPMERMASEIADRLCAELPDVPAYRRTKVRCLYSLAEIMAATDRAHDAVRLFEQAVELLAPFTEGAKADLLARLELPMILYEQGEALREDGRGVDSEKAILRSIGLAEKLVAETSGENNCRYILACSRIELGRTLVPDPSRRKDAEKAFDDAMSGLSKLPAEFPLRPDYRKMLAVAHHGRGAVRESSGQPLQAEDDYNRARTLLTGLLRQSPDVTDYEGHLGLTLAGLGRIAFQRGESTAARALFEEAAARHRASLKANPMNRSDREALRRNLEDLRRMSDPKL